MNPPHSDEPSLLRTGGVWNWLKSISDEAYIALNDACRPLQLPRGEMLYHRGDEVTSIYQIISGRVQFSVFSSTGKEIRYVHMVPGDCFGELSIFGGRPAHHDAEAEVDTVILKISAQDFHRLRKAFPEINEALLLFLARRVRTVYDTLDDAYLLDMPHRLGRRLWVLYRASLREELAGNITISHEDLAMMIGSSRQSVTGFLKGWEREGWLVQSYGQIELLLPEKLLAFISE
mgnify:FL=1